MHRAKIQIRRMSLQLPAGFEHRADGIARMVVDQLARLPMSSSVNRDRLSLSPLQFHYGETDSALASRIAHAIHAQINKQI